MNKLNYVIVFLLGVAYAAHPLQSQELDIEEEVRLWTELSLKKEIVDDLELSTDLQYRRDNDLQSFDRFLIQPTLEYKINKRFDAEVGYRYTMKLDEKGHRWFVALNYDKEVVKRLDFKYRLKYQHDYYPQELTLKRLRNKIELEYNIRKVKWTPEVGLELFTVMGEDGMYFNRTRLAMGWSRKIIKNQDIAFSLYRQWEYFDEIPNNSTIFILTYKVEL